MMRGGLDVVRGGGTLVVFLPHNWKVWVRGKMLKFSGFQSLSELSFVPKWDSNCESLHRSDQSTLSNNRGLNDMKY